jgi:Peptidase family M28
MLMIMMSDISKSSDFKLERLREDLRKHVKTLAVDIGPRTPSAPGSLERAAKYISSVFRNGGLSVREQNYDYYSHVVTNVLATVPATAGAADYYVVGAHYDTVPTTPGADDNASALGALILEMVGYTSPRQHYPFLPRWPGYPAEGDFIGIIGNWRSLRFGRAVLKAFRNNRDLPVESLFLPFDGWILPETRLSDHASFWNAGLPALMVTDTAFFRNPNYHLPSDTIDTLDFTFMAELVKSLELALLELPSASPKS